MNLKEKMQETDIVLSAERDIYGQSYQVADFYKYDFLGKPKNRKRITSFLVEQTETESHQEEWSYYSGIWGQLYQTLHRYGSGNWVRLSNNSYDIDGKVVRRTRGYYNNQGLKTDYQYNIRGWLTSQSSPLFSQNLFYTEPVDSTPNMVLLSVPKYYNGNIAGLNESRWTPQGVITGYRAVSYDNIGRIKNVYDSEPNRFNEWYSYDLNGNITSIRRGEFLNTLYDDISISYVGNRMDRVVDNSETDEFLGEIPQLGATGHLLLTDTIGYDASGRLTSDYSRGITQVVYNLLDLPSTVRMGSKDRINYTYRSDGVKMREQSTHQYTKLVMKISSSGDTTYVQRNASDTHFRARYGNYVKETGQPDKIYNEEGYIALHGDSVSYHFFERDYLGSVRAVFDLYGNLEQTNDYNVTGIPSSRHLGNADVHKHTGKEFQGFNGLAWYDNNARYYDPILARFTTQDPLAEKYPWLSPYNHCANNPLRYTDKDGRILRDENGEIVYLTDGTMAEFEHPSGSKAQLEVGYVFANNFTPIVVFNNISDDIEWDTNCHGTSFIEGKYWLNNDQVNSLLEGDNYISIPIKKAQKGDIVLFHGDSRNEHSMTILETNGRRRKCKKQFDL